MRRLAITWSNYWRISNEKTPVHNINRISSTCRLWAFPRSASHAHFRFVDRDSQVPPYRDDDTQPNQNSYSDNNIHPHHHFYTHHHSHANICISNRHRQQASALQIRSIHCLFARRRLIPWGYRQCARASCLQPMASDQVRQNQLLLLGCAIGRGCDWRYQQHRQSHAQLAIHRQ